ncbi:VPLPA-CTERM sorting domain-containing protein [Gammaproteobacteria bacterium]|nr:VPLPA-CTERM sorting domain-containing protein [Gammaproteobacteria bacterium]
MNFIFRTISILLTCLFSSAVLASTVLIDFEEFSIGDGPVSDTNWLESSGYEFNGNGFPGPIPDGIFPEVFIGDNGTNAFGLSSTFPGQDGYNAYVYVSMRKADGGAFAINSMDLLLQSLGSPLSSGSTGIYGTLAGGGAADLSVAIGTGDWLNLQHVTFEASGDNSGQSGFTGVEIDNVNVSAVPVPAAVWLFGSALAGLGWLRRKPAA